MQKLCKFVVLSTTLLLRLGRTCFPIFMLLVCSTYLLCSTVDVIYTQLLLFFRKHLVYTVSSELGPLSNESLGDFQFSS